jgi:hypothetical protein
VNQVDRPSGIDNVEQTCQFVRKQIRLMTTEVRKANRKENHFMASATQEAAKKQGEGKPLLRGENVPKKMWNGFKMKIKDVRVAPENWTGVFIVEFNPIKGLPNAATGDPFTDWAVNKTNTALLTGLFGDDTDKWIGKEPTLFVMMVNNPTTKKPTPSLQVETK